MHIAEVIYPGTWLALDDRDIAFELEGMVSYLGDRLAEAAIALTMFESSNRGFIKSVEETTKRDAEIGQEIDTALRNEIGEDQYYRNFETLRFETQHRVLDRKRNLEIFPRSYVHKIPFMHAHSFVYAIDSFGKFLDELCDYDEISDAVREVRDEFHNKLPALKKIRDSALHAEDRSRAYASANKKKKGERMQVNGFLGLSNLEGNQLCYTVADGSYQKVTIIQETLAVVTETMSEVLQALPWTGPAHLEPS